MPLIDRTKKQAFDVNVNPNIVAMSKALKDNNNVLYDSVDANYNEFKTYTTGRGYIINCGTFTSPTSGILLDGGYF